MSTSVYTGLNLFNFIRKHFLQICVRTVLCAVASLISFSCANLCNEFDGLRSIESETSINFLSLSLGGLPIRSAPDTEPVSRNFSISLQTAMWWGTGVSGKFSADCSCTKSAYLLPSQKMYSTRKTCSSIERTIVSKNWIKQLYSLPVLHFNRCLTTEYSETTVHYNGNYDTDNQIYTP
jgi:hypothetical protein